MKTNFRNILLLLVFSLTLSGSNENISTTIQDEILTIQRESIDNTSPNKPTDFSINLRFTEIRPDSLLVSKNKDKQVSDTTSVVVCKESSKGHVTDKQTKTTMFDLLVKWIVLLLEVS